MVSLQLSLQVSLQLPFSIAASPLKCRKQFVLVSWSIFLVVDWLLFIGVGVAAVVGTCTPAL